MNVIAPKVIRIELAVKFRSFGVTWGTLKRVWAIDLPTIEVVWRDAPSIHLDDRGVRLDVWVE